MQETSKIGAHSGIIVYVNNSPISWYGKNQDKVEA